MCCTHGQRSITSQTPSQRIRAGKDHKIEERVMRETMANMVHATQDTICEALQEIDGTTYREDTWERDEGGGGRVASLATAKSLRKLAST